MADAAKDITKATTSIASDLTKWLKKKRDEKIAKLKKGEGAEKKGGAGAKKKTASGGGAKAKADKPADWDKTLHTITFRCSKRGETLKRTPEKQAEMVANHASDSCASSHMVDKARHVEMILNGGLSWDTDTAFGTGEKQFATLKEFVTYFNTLFGKYGVVGAKQTPRVADGDKFHIELPDSRVPRGDPKVKSCIDCYAKNVYLDKEKWPKGPYGTFENNFKGPELTAAIKKYKAERQKLDDEKERDELAALRFTGELSAVGTAFKNAADKVTKKVPIKTAIQPPPKTDTGKGKPKPVKHVVTTKAKSTVGGTITVGINYNIWEYPNLTQTFISDVSFSVIANLNRAQGMINTLTAEYQMSVSLTKSDTEPSGLLVVEYFLDGLGSYDHTGMVKIGIAGTKATTVKND